MVGRAQSSKPGKGSRFFCFSERPHRYCSPPSLRCPRYLAGSFSRDKTGQCVDFTSDCYLVSRLKMWGALPLLSPHAFMARTGINLPCTCVCFFIDLVLAQLLIFCFQFLLLATPLHPPTHTQTHFISITYAALPSKLHVNFPFPCLSIYVSPSFFFFSST